jgi:hypothetical protein
VKRLFASTLEEFVKLERENILNGVSERNLCARFASYLEKNAKNSGLKGYYADVEYNRNQGRVKTIIDDEHEVVVINCDIILHSRGEQGAAHDNLIAIEMKKAGRPEEEKRRDRLRLRALTKASYDGVWSADGETFPEHVCGYKVGYFLEIDAANRTISIEQYSKGNFCGTRIEKF